MATIAGLVVEISANARKFHSAVNDIKSRAQKFARQLKTIIGAAVKAVVAGATAAAAAVTTVVTQTSLAMRDLVRDAEAVGTSARDLQAWQVAAKGMGIEADKVNDIMKDVNDKIGDFVRTGGGEAADIFEQLGLSAQDFIGLAPDQALLRISSALDGLSTGEKTFFMESLADDASRLLPLLDNNAERFRTLAQEGREWGQIMTDAEIKASAALGNTLTKAGRMASGFKQLLGTNLAPTFSALIGWIEDLTAEFGGPRKAAESMARGIVQAMIDTVEGIQSMIASLKDAYYWYIRIRELELNTQAALEAGQNFVTGGTETPAMDALNSVRETRADLESGAGLGAGTIEALEDLKQRIGTAGSGVQAMGGEAEGASRAVNGFASALNDAARGGLVPTNSQQTAPERVGGLMPTGEQSSVPGLAGGQASAFRASTIGITPMSQAAVRAMQTSSPAATGASATAATSGMAGQGGRMGGGKDLGTLRLTNDKGESADFFTDNADAAQKWLADTLSATASSV